MCSSLRHPLLNTVRVDPSQRSTHEGRGWQKKKRCDGEDFGCPFEIGLGFVK